MHRLGIARALALLGTLGAAEPSRPVPSGAATSPSPVAECPQDGALVVVKALRFRGEPPAFSFMVTNRGTNPIDSISLGAGGDMVADTYIEAGYESIPASVGSPRGWRGMHVFAQDPRLPEAHSHSLVAYLWQAEDPLVRIQPGESLAGFSVQLPATKRRPSGKPRHPPHPDLTAVPFRARFYAARCPAIGTVEPDRVGEPAGHPEPGARPASPAR